MCTIGPFSHIGKVSVKTLRYYDSIFLLVPAYTDKFTNYRYYSEEQVSTLLFILELKRYGLKLEQIKNVVGSNDTALLKALLTEQLDEIEKRIQRDTELKSLVRRKLNKICSGGSIMEERKSLGIELKEFNPVSVISVRDTISIDNIGAMFGKAFETAFKNGITPAGAPMTVYHDIDFNYEHTDIEVVLPVNDEGRKIKPENFSPGLCAYTIYTGAYSSIGDAYAAVMKWIETNGYKISGAPFDMYIKGPREASSPDEFVTEVYFPVKKKL